MKVLIVDLLLLGDVINGAFVASGLSGENSSSQIDLLTYAGNMEISKLCKTFSNIFCVNKESLLEVNIKEKKSLLTKYQIIEKQLSILFQKNYDLVVNLTNNKISAIICSLISSKKKCGAVLADDKKLTITGYNAWINYFNDFVTENNFNSYQYIDVFKRSLNISRSAKNEKIIHCVPTDKMDFLKGKKYFILKPTTSETKKNWDPKNYALLCKKIIKELGYECFIVGLQNEKMLMKTIKDEIGKNSHIGIFSLNDLASVISSSEFIIGGDTGVLHLAAAMNKKTITITLGPGTFFKSTPYGEGNVVLYTKEKCYPCNHLTPCEHELKCGKSIEPKDVFNAIAYNKINSSRCGAITTYFDESGMLSYENINESVDFGFVKYLRTRGLIYDYLNNRDMKEYNYDELKNILAGESGHQRIFWR